MSYAAAVFPDQWRCAGVALRTLTLGHALLLQRLGNPFAARPLPGGTGRLGDVSQALMVCSRAWSEARDMIDTRAERWWLAWRAITIRHHGIEKADAELSAYLTHAWPEVNWWTPTDGRTRALGAELLHILVNVERRMGLSLEDALGVPVAVAYWDAAADAERSGAISLRSEADEAMSRAYDDLTARGLLPKPGTVINRN